ncbi:hypothetical protein [Larkinella sp.]|uniref:hypothetical protein n=1 Tax=Larkinella sp. TaxID=2034517 RepID=UPI003BAD0BD7
MLHPYGIVGFDNPLGMNHLETIGFEKKKIESNNPVGMKHFVAPVFRYRLNPVGMEHFVALGLTQYESNNPVGMTDLIKPDKSARMLKRHC